MNTPLLLEIAAEAMGERVAVGPSEGGLSYAELLDRARRTATVVAGSGAQRLALVDVNSEFVPQLLFAAGLAGVPFVPVNYRLADDRLRAVLARTTPALVLADPAAAARSGEIDGMEICTREVLAERATLSTPTTTSKVAPDDIAVLLFTSGTTGEPKAAVLRHRHLTAYVMSTVEFMSAAEEDAALVSVPPYHVAGVAAVLSSVFSGRRIVYVPQFEPSEWVNTARREAITHAMVVPTMLGRILDVVERQGATLPALRHLSYGGGRMPLPVIERAMELLPHVGFVNAYGLTETSSTIAVLGPEEHREAFSSGEPAVRARLGSVGRPLPSLELAIMDASGRALAAGESGEICVRGEQVAGEYLGKLADGGTLMGSDPAPTAVGTSAATAGGWFRTSDAGYLDAEGYLFVEGRLDDVIVRGGENLSPGEIEDVLLAHPAVADAGVVGVPDDDWGETVAAAVVARPGASVTPSELCEWVKGRLRSSHAPTRVEFRQALPYNDTGKLLRRVLRAELTRAASAGQV
ncbi:MAG: class I adenylate-forming enzyme family protein [Acidimicrobiales bacterium]